MLLDLAIGLLLCLAVARAFGTVVAVVERVVRQQEPGRPPARWRDTLAGRSVGWDAVGRSGPDGDGSGSGWGGGSDGGGWGGCGSDGGGGGGGGSM